MSENLGRDRMQAIILACPTCRVKEMDPQIGATPYDLCSRCAESQHMIFGRDDILRFFTFEHLPLELRAVSERFAVLANWLVGAVPGGPERAAALRSLLVAKDAAVRAALP